MNDISDMNNLVQDVLDGVENPERARKVIEKRRDAAIEMVKCTTSCLEEIEGSDIEEAQRKVLKSRMSGYLYTITEGIENLDEILNTTKETNLVWDLRADLSVAEYRINEFKNKLG